jgi:hypothetical protein
MGLRQPSKQNLERAKVKVEEEDSEGEGVKPQH